MKTNEHRQNTNNQLNKKKKNKIMKLTSNSNLSRKHKCTELVKKKKEKKINITQQTHVNIKFEQKGSAKPV